MQKKNKQSTGKSNIPGRITARELQERLKNNPDSFTDSDVVEAIRELQDLCVRGTVEQSRKAREILSTLLIPKGSTTRKTDNWDLAFWKQNLESLVECIHHYGKLMRPGWDKGKTKRERREKAFKCLFRRYPTEEEYRDLTKEGRTVRDRNFGDFVLSCFAFFCSMPFARLKDFYYSDKVQQEKDKFLELQNETALKGVKTPELEVVRMRGGES